MRKTPCPAQLRWLSSRQPFCQPSEHLLPTTFTGAPAPWAPETAGFQKGEARVGDGGASAGTRPSPRCGSCSPPARGLISSISMSVTCLTNLLFRSLRYTGSELLLCPRPSPRVALPCHVINICGRSYGSPDALRGLGSPAPASGSSRVFLDLTSHAEALVPEASLSAPFTGHPTLHYVLLFHLSLPYFS